MWCDKKVSLHLIDSRKIQSDISLYTSSTPPVQVVGSECPKELQLVGHPQSAHYDFLHKCTGGSKDMIRRSPAQYDYVLLPCPLYRNGICLYGALLQLRRLPDVS